MPGPAPPKSLSSHRTLLPSSDQMQGLHGTVTGMGLGGQALGPLAPPGLPASSQLTYLPPSPSLRPLSGQTEPHLPHQSAESHASRPRKHGAGHLSTRAVCETWQGEKFQLDGSCSMLPVCSSRIRLQALPWCSSG